MTSHKQAGPDRALLVPKLMPKLITVCARPKQI